VLTSAAIAETAHRHDDLHLYTRTLEQGIVSDDKSSDTVRLMQAGPASQLIAASSR
jgi:hypothetical protein